ncbi:alkaline phosphatase PhoX [Acaryochloris thomasi]|nr:alkaline phosphatase PhoX [Acaryochloris thomasi]
MAFSRRQFLTVAGVTAGTVVADPLRRFHLRASHARSLQGKGYGPLIPDPQGILDLPKGFQYRAFSRTGERMNDGNLVPADHDGMSAFSGPNNTIVLVRNHELSPSETPGAVGPKYDSACAGGTTTLTLNADRRLLRHHVSLAGTYRNCSGGATPWDSWISCEEDTSTPRSNPILSRRHGYNFEVPALLTEPVIPEPLVAMGRFYHEAIAVDPSTGIVYQTEDRGDGLLYRFIPHEPGNLKAGGVLEALKIKEKPQANTKVGFALEQSMAVEWVRIEDPDPAEDTVRQEGFAKGAAQFSRGEGLCFDGQDLYVCCTSGGKAGLGQVWRYRPEEDGGQLTLFVESSGRSQLDYPDNITASSFGDLFVSEDGWGEQFVRGIQRDGKVYDFARNALNTSEFAGVCFATNPLTMFVNIQSPGITLAIWGPFIS